jgi:hypothetical protein
LAAAKTKPIKQKKKLNKLFTILLIAVAFASCKTAQLPTITEKVIIKDSVVVKTDTQYSEKIIQLPGDTTEISVAIPCPDVKIDVAKTNGRTTLTAKTDGRGYLKIDCKTDSLTLVIDSLKTIITETQKFHSELKQVVVEKPVTVTKYKVPKWCWWLLIINIAYLAWRFKSPIGSFIKTLVK